LKQLPSPPDEIFTSVVPLPNKITCQTFEDTDAGRNLVVCEDADEMFRKLGIGNSTCWELAGIWQDRDITQEAIRKEAWPRRQV
jgi:hypothetical protein